MSHDDLSSTELSQVLNNEQTITQVAYMFIPLIPCHMTQNFDWVYKILTNGPHMKFDKQNFDKFTVAFIGKVVQ